MEGNQQQKEAEEARKPATIKEGNQQQKEAEEDRKPAAIPHQGMAVMPSFAELNEYDVPFGSGHKVNQHLQRHYKKLISDHREMYQNLEKQKKRDFAAELVSQIQARGGKFLQIDDGEWKKVTDKMAVSKVMQSLRQSTSKGEDTIKKFGNESDSDSGNELLEDDEELKHIHAASLMNESGKNPKAVSQMEMKLQIENWSKRLEGYQQQAEDINSIVDKLNERCQALLLENERLKSENAALILENKRLKGEDIV